VKNVVCYTSGGQAPAVGDGGMFRTTVRFRAQWTESDTLAAMIVLADAA